MNFSILRPILFVGILTLPHLACAQDTDSDGLEDSVETGTGIWVSPTNTGTNPALADTDTDGFADGLEALYSNANPNSATSRPLRSGLLDLLAYWPFNDASNPGEVKDTVKGFVGILLTGNDSFVSTYSNDGEGRSGLAGDRAIELGPAGGNATGIDVEDGEVLNIAATQNQVAFSFWQKLHAVTNSTSFKGLSPSSTGTERGASGHAPWGNNNYYFDTAGCCDGTQRISGANPAVVNLIDEWHHFVFQKNGNQKQIWVDGIMRVSGTNTAPLPADFRALAIGHNESAENVAGLIDDFAIFGDALTPAEIAQLAGGATPPSIVPASTDTDGDGMPNGYETANGLNPNVDDRTGDIDADGKTNLDEFLAGTLPNNADSDGDTLKDGVETKTGTYVNATNTGTDPLKADTDGDGLNDNLENNSGTFVSAANPGTNPNKADTDDDTWDDSTEVNLGSNPHLAASVPTFDLAWWPFNDASDPLVSSDVVHQFEASFLNGAAFSDDALGRTGQAGDRALNFGTDKNGAMAKVMDAAWLNLAAANDDIAFSFWQNLDSVSNSSSFWASSPSSTGTERGAQGHATWGDNNYYWDTAGCCDPTQRTSGPNDVDPFVGTWHHFVFQKSGPDKQIWVDGVLKVTGSNDAPLPNDFYELTIGAEPSGANNTLGLMDDFAVFGNVLTEVQIGRLAAGEPPTALFGPTAPLAITAFSFNAGTHTVQLTWASQAGAKYALEGSRTMASGSWIEINDNITSGGATTTFTYDVNLFPPGGSTPPILFLRVVKP